MGEQENQLTAAIEAAINAGEWAQGAQLAEQFCRIQPKDAGAWVSRATCLRHLGRIAEALGCARTALSLDESSAEVSDLVKILQRDLSPPQMDSQSAFDSDGLAPTLRDEDPPIEGPDVSEGSLTGAPSSQVVQWDEGDLIDGRYAVQGVMRGGMGEVYFAHDRELGLDIAVKTPLPSALATSSGRARFLREAEAWIGLGLHPNICSAYYVKSIAGIPRLFIEYVDGGSLSQWFKHNRLADTVERLDVAIQITSGMHHAHTFAWRDEEGSEHRGIVHRDLKPANVLMSSRGVPRVTDFGLVGRSDESSDPVETRQVQAPTEVPMTEDSQTSSRSVLAGEVTSSGGVWETVTVGGMAMGTPPYMPPEQWDGAHRAGFPADVYAFGCVLYELFCGRRVFVINPELRRARGDVVKLEWERLHREVEPEDPRKIVADLDPELAMLMGECVSKDPADRPSGFGEVGERLLAVYVRISGRPYPRPAARPSRLLANTLNNRGVSFVTLDQRQRAGRAFAEALRVDPTHFRARYNHTLFSWRYGGATDVEVVEQLDEAFRSGAYDWRDELLAGRLEQTLGYLDRGAGRCERARKRADGESQAERVAAISMCGLLAGNPAEDRAPEIRDRIVRIAQSEPGDPQVQVALAVAADRVEGKAEEARQALAIARQLRPDLPSDIQSAGVQMIPGQSFRYRYPERTGRLVALALSRDGKRLVVAAEGGTVTTVDAIEGRQVERVTLQQRRISALSVLDGGRQALIASPGEPVFSAQLQDGKVTKKYQLHSGHLNGLVVSETAGIVLAVGSDGAATAWDLNSGERVWSKRLHKGFASSVSMTPDGNLAISGGRDGIARVFLPATGDVARELAAHSGEISTVAIEPSGRFFLTGSADKTVKLWSRIGECERILRGHADRISFVAISAGGETAASGSIDGIVRLWDLASGEPLLSVKLDAAIQMGTASSDFGVVMAGHPAGVSALALTGKPELRPGWSVASLVTVGESEERAESFSEHMDQARRLLAQEEFAGAWEEVEKARGIQGYERVEEAVDLATTIGRPFARVQLNAAWEEQSLELHQGAVTALAMADDDSRILTSGSDHRLILCDLSSDEQFRELSSEGELNA
ncbi:MAG: protein kinase [bacterium]|nr:protein kinase [bacterium]